MITQYEVSHLLKDEIPQLEEKTYPAKLSLEIYAAMNYFTDYTRHAVKEHDLICARKCFALAEKLYRQGDKLVRLLI